MDERAVLDHQFLVAAYSITWALHLSYLAWMGVRWRKQKLAASRSTRAC